MVKLIAAMSRNRVIGADNALPWRLPADLAFFKQTTLGHAVVMGRKTFESIGRPLPGRRNLVLTRNPDYAPPGCEMVSSVRDALDAVGDDELFVIGGAEVYRQFLPYAGAVYLTVLEHDFEGDAFFPQLDSSEWELRDRREGERNDRNPYDYSFLLYQRTGQ